MEFRDYYAVLGVPPTATPEQIERAYKRLVTFSHPDVFPNDPQAQAWANERMKQIHEAYETLRDPAKRSIHDRAHQAPREEHRQGSTHRQSQQRQESRVRCPLCEGEGETTCLTCQGNGDWNCPGCAGDGTVVCPVCQGAGSLTQAEYDRLREEVERAQRQAQARQRVEQDARRRRAEAGREAEAQRRAEEEARRQAAVARGAQAERARKAVGTVVGLLVLLFLGRSCLSGASAPTSTPVDPPTPTAADPNAPGPSTVGEAVEATLTSWIDTLRNKDFDTHMTHYAPILERYFLKRNASWQFVYDDKKRILKKYPNPVEYRIANLRTDSVAEGIVVSIFDKSWDFRTVANERFAGEVRQRLKLRQAGVVWEITSEEELDVFWVVKPPKPSPQSAGNNGSDLRSIHSRYSTSVTFVNESSRAVRVLWISYEGREVPYRTLWSGSWYRQQTFATHPWRIRDAQTGRVLKEFVATEYPMTVTVRD